MTYRNKTITKHVRGNWFARVRHNGKWVYLYGRTQLDVCAKLKVFCDKVEQTISDTRFLQKLESLTASSITPLIQQPAQAEIKTVKAYTLREWFDEWLNSYKIGNVRAVTIDGFKTQFRKLKKLYDTPICEITNLLLSKAINEVALNRVKDGVHNLLKQLFAVAFNNRLIETNPAANLPRPKQFAVYEKHAFTEEQEKKFIDVCLADLDKYEPFLICVLQGLRKGEMLALRPNDFDFENNTLRIDESFDVKHPEDL